MSTTNFSRGHAAQAQVAPIRGSGDGYRLRSRSVDASAKVGNRRPTPVRYPKGQESTLDTEIELRNVTLAKTTNLTQDRTENLTLLVPAIKLDNESIGGHYTPLQWPYLLPFMRYSASRNSVTLKTGLGVVQGH